MLEMLKIPLIYRIFPRLASNSFIGTTISFRANVLISVFNTCLIVTQQYLRIIIVKADKLVQQIWENTFSRLRSTFETRTIGNCARQRRIKLVEQQTLIYIIADCLHNNAMN